MPKYLGKKENLVKLQKALSQISWALIGTLEDIGLMQDNGNHIPVIMKDGIIMKNELL